MGDILDFPKGDRLCICCGRKFKLDNGRSIMNDDVLYCEICRKIKSLPTETAQPTEDQAVDEEKPTLGQLIMWARQQ